MQIRQGILRLVSHEPRAGDSQKTLETRNLPGLAHGRRSASVGFEPKGNVGVQERNPTLAD